jgi:hypothetical protein
MGQISSYSEDENPKFHPDNENPRLLIEKRVLCSDYVAFMLLSRVARKM